MDYEATAVYTTTEAAKVCQVSVATVSHWFDTGLIAGYRLPPRRKLRRILRSSLEAFLVANNMPLAHLSPAGRRVEVESRREQ